MCSSDLILMSQMFGHNGDGCVFAINENKPIFAIPVVQKEALNPEYLNLIVASALLYRTAFNTSAFLEALIEWVDCSGKDGVSRQIMEVQAALNSSMKIAIHGFDAISKK